MKQFWSYVAGIWIIMGFNLIATILNSSSPAILVFQVVCVFGQFNILAFAIVDVLQDKKEDGMMEQTAGGFREMATEKGIEFAVLEHCAICFSDMRKLTTVTFYDDSGWSVDWVL